jgi:hypothetical protein
LAENLSGNLYLFSIWQITPTASETILDTGGVTGKIENESLISPGAILLIN